LPYSANDFDKFSYLTFFIVFLDKFSCLIFLVVFFLGALDGVLIGEGSLACSLLISSGI
jgi:hypothetical protein